MTPTDELFVFPPEATLSAFNDIWEHCFLFGLFSSLFVHAIAALVAFSRLRKHQWGRFFPILIIMFGVVPPLTYGAITSAAVAGICTASQFSIAPIYTLVWGVAQMALVLFLSYTTFLFTV